MAAVITLRRAPAPDSTLSQCGVNDTTSKVVLVGERGGTPLGQISFVPRPFETEFLKRRTCHIEAIAATGSQGDLTALVSAGVGSLASEGYRFVTCRWPDTDRNTVAALQDAGFHIIECLLTLARPLTAEGKFPDGVELANPSDAEGCAGVAHGAFRFDRFHADVRIDNRFADALKAQWARNSVMGRADAVFLTRDEKGVTGFNACLLRDGDARIDLIGVVSNRQGQGLGRKLTMAALAHYAGQATRIKVSTQSSNRASLALYESLVFRIDSS